MAKQVLIKGKRVSHNGVTVESDADGHVDVSVGSQGMTIVEEDFLRLYDIICHLVDWQ